MKKGLLSISGFVFWFIVAFPFGLRNEAYEWVVYLATSSLWDITVHRIPAILSYRPIAQVIAWSLFRLFAQGAVVAVQLLNFLLLLAAVYVFYKATTARDVFSVLSLLTGTVFFSVFYYLFQVQGIFYSPLILFLAVVTHLHVKATTRYKYVLVSGLGLLCSFLHPASLLIAASFLAGSVLESYKVLGTKRLSANLLLALLLLLVFSCFVSDVSNGHYLGNLYSSLFGAELRGKLSFVSWAASCFVVSSGRSRPEALYWCLGVSLVCLGLFVLEVPVIVLLIAILVLKLALSGERCVALMFLSLLALPMGVASGSPVKSCLVFAFLPYVIARQANFAKAIGDGLEKAIPIVLTTIVVSGAYLRQGGNVPGVSEFVRPILVEKEKTLLLRELFEWKERSDFRGDEFCLYDDQAGGKKSHDILARETIPPTSQDYLKTYEDYLFEKNRTRRSGKKLYVSFGGSPVGGEEFENVYSLQGKYGCSAVVSKRRERASLTQTLKTGPSGS